MVIVAEQACLNLKFGRKPRSFIYKIINNTSFLHARVSCCYFLDKPKLHDTYVEDILSFLFQVAPSVLIRECLNDYITSWVAEPVSDLFQIKHVDDFMSRIWNHK